MLSQQASTTNPGRHQRQNSTPTKFNTSKIFYPAQFHQRQQRDAHRRDLSLDESIDLHDNNGFPQQDEHSSSVENLLRQRLTQSTMREAQQQQQQQTARPGPDIQEREHVAGRQQQQHYITTNQLIPGQEPGVTSFADGYTTIQLPDFEDEVQNLLNNAYKTVTTDMLQSFDTTNSAGNLDGFGNKMDGYTGSIPTNEIMNTRPTHFCMRANECSHQVNGSEGPQRPCTPPNQTRNGYFPMTPAATPFSQNSRTKNASHSRTAESSPTRRDPNLTIKASHAMQRGTSCQDNFTAMRQHVVSPMPSPPHTAPLRPRSSVDLAAFPQPDFFSMESLQTNIPAWNNGYNAANYSPESDALSSAWSSFQSSPEVAHMSLYEDREGTPNNIPISQSTAELSTHSSPATKDKQARSQSMSEIDPLECIEDTGISSDHVDSFIQAEPENRWSCLFPDCGKSFGRKENVKSHVQTHLDDRQYRCKDCNKRFVRQHDLKRHANIHSGVRSYPCPCGKPFARHDALTRHRQRGMCVGAFAGTPKKVAKRGRPKKTRPENGEILEKAARTRQAALDKRYPGKYTSSVSGSSVSSYPSPEPFIDDMDFTTTAPSHPQMSPEQTSDDLTFAEFTYTPPTSPSYSTGNCFSSQHSQHSHTPKAFSMSPSPKITAIPEEQQQLPSSQSQSRKSSSSYFSTPPELDLTSSSPAASKFFDVDGGSEAGSSQTLPMLSATDSEFFTKDFDLSAVLSRELAKGEAARESNNSIYSEYLTPSDMIDLEGSNSLSHSMEEDQAWTDFMDGS